MCILSHYIVVERMFDYVYIRNLFTNIYVDTPLLYPSYLLLVAL